MTTNNADFWNRHAEFMRLDRAMTELRQQMRADMRYMLDVFKIEGVGRVEISRRMGRGKTYAGDMCSERILPPDHAYSVCYPRLLKLYQERQQ